MKTLGRTVSTLAWLHLQKAHKLERVPRAAAHVLTCSRACAALASTPAALLALLTVSEPPLPHLLDGDTCSFLHSGAWDR